MDGLDRRILDGVRAGTFYAGGGGSSDTAWSLTWSPPQRAATGGDPPLHFLRHQNDMDGTSRWEEFNDDQAAALLRATGVRRRLIATFDLTDDGDPRRATSLDALDGRAPSAVDGPSDLVRRCQRLRAEPIGRLDPDALRLLLGQRIGARWLLPLAAEHLRREPYLEATFFPGDLLEAARTAAEDPVVPQAWRQELDHLARSRRSDG